MSRKNRELILNTIKHIKNCSNIPETYANAKCTASYRYCRFVRESLSSINDTHNLNYCLRILQFQNTVEQTTLAPTICCLSVSFEKERKWVNRQNFVNCVSFEIVNFKGRRESSRPSSFPSLGSRRHSGSNPEILIR